LRLDALYLWYLGDPDALRCFNAIELVTAGKGVSLHFCDEWL
jgi:serine/threonine-protein kinase HipA